MPLKFINPSSIQSPLWASTGHLQTILGFYLPSPKPKKDPKIIEVKLPDSDILVGEFYEGSKETLLYGFHGLAGSSDSAYMKRLAKIGEILGYSVLLMNHRGCGLGAGKAHGIYHSGIAKDLATTISFGRSLGFKKHISVGFSLGANANLLLATGEFSDCPDFSLAVNAPIHLENCAKIIKTGLNRIYDFNFIKDLKKEIKFRKKKYKISSFMTMHDFDNAYTAPEGGFKSREDYYETCSAKFKLEKIKIPTIIITSKDDPFIPVKDYEDALFSKLVHCHIEKAGGHLGYLSREFYKDVGSNRWIDQAILSYLKQLEKI